MFKKYLLAAGALALALPGLAFAEDGVSPGLFAANNVWSRNIKPVHQTQKQNEFDTCVKN